MGGQPIAIGIDARYGLRYPRRGVGEYVYRLFQELGQMSHRGYQMVLFGDQSADESVVREFQGTYPVIIIRSPNFFFWEQIEWPRQARAQGIAVLHGTANIAPLAWNHLLLTVHDVIEWHRGLDFPGDISLRHRLSRTYRMNTLRILAPRAQAIFTVSEHAMTGHA